LLHDGSEVSIKVEQMIECNNEDHPVAYRDHYMETNENASGEILNSRPDYRVISNMVKHRKGIRLVFDNELCKGDQPILNSMEWKIIDGYKSDKEWFTILQMNESVEEIFILKIPLSKPLKHIYCEKLELSDSIKLPILERKEVTTDTHYITEIRMPTIGSGMKHKICWEF